MNAVHVVLEEPIYFQLELEGETVVGLDIHAGHVHRGMEFLAMQRNIYQNITFTERVCSLCSNNHPFTYCMAVEKIAGISIPERAKYLRVIADEVKRMASHLFNTGMIAHIIGFDTLFMQVMEVREEIQDLKEAVYGNRMNLSANCIGGVRYDVTDEQTQYIRTCLQKIKKPVDDLIAIYKTNSLIRKRTEGVGVLPKDKAVEYGVVGPVARGSGLSCDVRSDNPYAAYENLTFEVAVEHGGDVYSRALVRLREVREAVGLIEQCLSLMPEVQPVWTICRKSRQDKQLPNRRHRAANCSTTSVQAAQIFPSG